MAAVAINATVIHMRIVLFRRDRTHHQPADDEHHNADVERIGRRPHRPGHKDVEQQNPHRKSLQKTAHPPERRPDSWTHMRWKFFSISRRVSRSITGRPCGHTVEYAV